eukprot:5812167-Pleurochrysis_carterae.AAC.2
MPHARARFRYNGHLLEFVNPRPRDAERVFVGGDDFAPRRLSLFVATQQPVGRRELALQLKPAAAPEHCLDLRQRLKTQGLASTRVHRFKKRVQRRTLWRRFQGESSRELG